MSPFLSFVVTMLIFAGGVGFYFFWKNVRRNRLIGQLETKLFSIRIPKVSDEKKDLKKEIAVSEQLFNSIISFGSSVAFEVAVPHVGKEIHFYASVPARFAEPFRKQIQSLWSDSIVEAAEDYNIFNYSGVSAGAIVSEKERFVLPIRTYEEMEADSFLPILGGFANINDVGEGGAVQFVIRPAGKNFKKEIQSVLKNLKKGSKLRDVLKGGANFNLSEVSEALRGKSKKDKDQIVKADEEEVKIISSKLAKPLFEVNIRIAASAPSQFQADSILDGLMAGFSQVAAPDRNEFKVTRVKSNNREFFHNYSFRAFSSKGAIALTSGEIASIFHLPTSSTDIPNVKYVKSREAPPPPNLPKTGVLIGRSVFRGEAIDIRISDDDRRRHLYLIGQTGTGKSNLLANMAADDVRNGKGIAVIDPHGDLMEDILGLVPRNRMQDVIVFDPGDIANPVGLNMLEYDFHRPEEKTF
ncbi:MAG: DUF87 domain-containing protein, partial [Patescibacteria group bacterium]